MKDARIVDFKHPSYSKWRNNSLVEPDLYRKCWKRKSLVFVDENYEDVIGISYVQHSDKFPEYGKYGFHLLKLSIDSNKELSDYYKSISIYLHYAYDIDLAIRWIPEYIWWYKKDDMTGIIHQLLLESEEPEYVSYELIDRDDIYVFRLKHTFKHEHTNYITY